MSYEQIEEEISYILKKYWKGRSYEHKGEKRTANPRVISLDLETSPIKDTDFLTNERILAIAVARRLSGSLMSADGVEIRSYILNEDSDVGEYKLLESFNNELTPEPLAVIGYGIRDYDLPLLSIKMKRYDPSVLKNIPNLRTLWHIVNTLERAIPLDLMIRLRLKLNVSKFDDVIKHKKFAMLPIRKVKCPALPEGVSKGKYMYDLWKENREELRKLVEAHAYNVLLIAECEFFSNE
ncbi:MAG: hypothetical protein ACP5IT_12475 [Thermoproteota archaeon]